MILATSFLTWCDGLKVLAPIGIYFQTFGSQLDYLGKIRRCGFVGGDVSLGMSFEVSKAHVVFT